jgi:two-component system, cell cycle sensor histidine kinase and response regulator CckA
MNSPPASTPALRRLLHLEDNAIDAELVYHTLVQEWPDCSIERVQTQSEFVAALQREPFDLILSDFSLPGFNGMEALALARRMRSATPFLFLSGTIGEERAVEALKNGATDYLIKDRMRRLMPAVRRALEGVVEQRSRQQAELLLRDQANLLDKAQDAIYVRDLDDRVLYWNRSAERIFGYTAAEAVGRGLAELGLLHQDPQAFAEAKLTLLERGEWTGEFRAANKSKQEFDLIVRWTLVRDEGGVPRSILCIETDVTELKRMERQFLRAQRLESVGMLAGGIAHDLNNVLAPILMAVGLMQQKCTDPDQQHLLQVLETSAQHGAGLVRQVLAFSRGAEGERADLQPRLIVRDVAELLSETLPNSIVLETDLPKDLWLVRSNSTELGQVIMNLCVNARDAMPQGGNLTIRLRNVRVTEALAAANPGATAGPHVLITVTDTGSGIPPEVRDHIFDPFFSTKVIGKGTGLGLATVLGIVKSHHGFLEVQSEMGQGTVFSLYFPAIVAAEAARPREVAAAPARGRGETILVVEDKAGVLSVIQSLLKARGYASIPALDGMEALEIYRKRGREIQVVLTDMMMPGLQGVEVVRRLRAINPEVCVVAMSGIMEECEGLGEESARLTFLRKPMTADELVGAIQRVLPSGP